ncbi:MAG: hypothetical protein R2849_09490 [Thermomicrobiales bacterium]
MSYVAAVRRNDQIGLEQQETGYRDPFTRRQHNTVTLGIDQDDANLQEDDPAEGYRREFGEFQG